VTNCQVIGTITFPHVQLRRSKAEFRPVACVVVVTGAADVAASVTVVVVTGPAMKIVDYSRPNQGLHTHTHTRPFNGHFSGTRKIKPIWILLKQETVNGSGISWAICKSAPRSRQITTPYLTTQFFTGRMPFPPPNQQRQSTEGKGKQGLHVHRLRGDHWSM